MDKDATCKTDAASCLMIREKLPRIADRLIEACADSECYTHINFEPIPSKDSMIKIIDLFKEVIFPGYFARERLDPVNMKYHMGRAISRLYDTLSEQVTHSIRHDCFRYELSCAGCEERGHSIALRVLESISDIRKTLAGDVRAAYAGDPAAKSHDEIIFSYPGILSILVYRVAHKLYELEVPLLPRIMTEYAHSVTGIDIHPGARIGNRFVIDHGTGVVIGETTRIGDDVRIYQGVTLGALSLPKGAGDKLRDIRRHPTIEDDVIIYSGAMILGGDTIIGARSIIGGNVWITKSVPPDTTVMLETPRLVYKTVESQLNSKSTSALQRPEGGVYETV